MIHKKEMTTDDLAVFMATKLINMQNYNFDMFYDISHIVNKKRISKKEGNEHKIKEK